MQDSALVAAARKGAGITQGWLLLGVGLAMLALMLVLTIFAPLIAPYSSSATSPDSLAPASAANPKVLRVVLTVMQNLLY